MTILKTDDAPGDPAKGAKIFKEHCAGCHAISKDMKHKMGPNLYALWGRTASTLPDFDYAKGYTESEKKKGIIWGDESLVYYMTKVHIPGTGMIFKGLCENKQDRQDVIAYLKDATDPKKA
ncbi:putative cytochrome c, somatic-like [Apostichopus japonicus]|uniref:Putative cytochrome c, somatic-like n=1 Tax=Stichopus japonicus TaxID=307972 RepID=A0A2G8JUG1_STIJA|nr:putative cytochrome c, somatic-like [Apostichopus japonicus]